MASNQTSTLLPLDCGSVLEVAVPCLYFLMFPFALLLNGVAAWVSLHLRSTSTFMVYLKNLVAADLLMTLTIPLNAASNLRGSTLELRVFTCRFSKVIFYTCMYMSISLMGLISLDRFFKIVRPCGKLLGQNLLFSKVMSASVWVVLFGATAFPNMILSNQSVTNETKSICMSMKSPVGLEFHKSLIIFLNGLFWTLSILVVVCYVCITNKVLQSFRNSGSNNSQGKTKTKVRVFLVLIVFFVCFGPYHIVRVPYTLQQNLKVEACSKIWQKIAKELTLWLSTTNICLDPLLYFFLCREFREKLIGMLKGIFKITSGMTEEVSQ